MTDRHIDTHTDKQTVTFTQLDKQIDKRQSDRHIHTYTYTQNYLNSSIPTLQRCQIAYRDTQQSQGPKRTTGSSSQRLGNAARNPRTLIGRPVQQSSQSRARVRERTSTPPSPSTPPRSHTACAHKPSARKGVCVRTPQVRYADKRQQSQPN